MWNGYHRTVILRTEDRGICEILLKEWLNNLPTPPGMEIIAKNKDLNAFQRTLSVGFRVSIIRRTTILNISEIWLMLYIYLNMAI